jgi:hypothetical protein
VTRISEDRYSIELSSAQAPDRLLCEMLARGAHLVSLNPVRDTLEDLFVKAVAEQRREAKL